MNHRYGFCAAIFFNFRNTRLGEVCWDRRWLPTRRSRSRHQGPLASPLGSRGHVLHLIVHSLVVFFQMCVLEGPQGHNLSEIVSA